MATPLPDARAQFFASEDELRRAEFRQLFAHASIGLGSLDADSRFFRVNEALAAMFGLPAARHIGRTLAEVHPAAAAQLHAPIEDALRNGRAAHAHSVCFGRDANSGRQQYADCSVTPILDDAGRVLGAGITAVDISRHVSDTERLAAAQRLNEQGTWEWNPHQDEFWCSAELQQIFGQEPAAASWTMDRLLRAVHPRDRRAVRETFASCAEGRADFELEFRVLRDHGTCAHVGVNGRVVRDERGNLLRAVGSGADVTERRRTELELSRQAQVFRQSYDAVFLVDPYGVVRTWNRGAESTLGYTAVEAVGRHAAFLKKEFHKAVIDFAVQSRTGGRGYLEREINLLDKRGKPISLELRISVLRDKRGYTDGYICSARDVTETRRTQEQLQRAHDMLEQRVGERTRQLDAANRTLQQKVHELERAQENARASEERLRLVADSAPVLIWLADAEGRCTFANHQAVEFFGPRMRLGETVEWNEVIHPADRPRLKRAWKERSPRASELQLDLRIRDAAGAYRWHICRAASWMEAGAVLAGCVGTFTDVSEQRRNEEERRKMEAQLSRAHKLESLGLLAGGVAHDFNNVLGAIRGHVSVALRQLPASHPGREHVAAVSAAAERAIDLTGQLLAYTGKDAPRSKRVEVCDVLTSVTGLLRCSLPADIHLVLYGDEGPHAVMADPAQLDQVLMNLILNASEVLGDEGVIHLTVGRVSRPHTLPPGLHGELDPAGEYVRITVRDNGPGIPKDILGRIFDPFFTTKPTGRGLGLATVIGIVRAHKGAIGVETDLGVGTRFRVYLPAAAEEPTRQSEEVRIQPQSEQPKDARVLFVDDEEPLRRLAKHLLGNAGLGVVTASSGEEALNLLTADPTAYGLVVLDMNMPGIGGLAAQKQFASIAPNLPVLISSGHEETDLRRTRELASFAGFVAKPYRGDQLLRAVHGAMGAIDLSSADEAEGVSPSGEQHSKQQPAEGPE